MFPRFFTSFVSEWQRKRKPKNVYAEDEKKKHGSMKYDLIRKPASVLNKITELPGKEKKITQYKAK